MRVRSLARWLPLGFAPAGQLEPEAGQERGGTPERIGFGAGRLAGETVVVLADIFLQVTEQPLQAPSVVVEQPVDLIDRLALGLRHGKAEMRDAQALGGGNALAPCVVCQELGEDADGIGLDLPLLVAGRAVPLWRERLAQRPQPAAALTLAGTPTVVRGRRRAERELDRLDQTFAERGGAEPVVHALGLEAQEVPGVAPAEAPGGDEPRAYGHIVHGLVQKEAEVAPRGALPDPAEPATRQRQRVLQLDLDENVHAGPLE
jgi:hypothetical protein